MHKMYESLHAAIRSYHAEHGALPICVLACQDGADEHWQIFNPDAERGSMPVLTVDREGNIEKHPG